MRFLASLLILLWLPVAGMAQENDEDPGYLAGLLQDALSGAGRDVRIRGFQGALSSEASIESMSISDAEGEWFRAENVVLDWTRSALLRGVDEFVRGLLAQWREDDEAQQRGDDDPRHRAPE